MGENSKIEWCDHTFNPWIGCQKVSPGCDHCYAEAMMDHRYKKVQWGAHGERKRTSEQNWKKPVQWNAQARTFRKEMAIAPGYFALRSPTSLIIGFFVAQGLVRFNPQMRRIRLVGAHEETRK